MNIVQMGRNSPERRQVYTYLKNEAYEDCVNDHQGLAVSLSTL